MEIVIRPYEQTFIDWSKDKPKVLVLSADLTNSCEIGAWAKTYPDRFFSMGLSEQNMMGVAAGLARRGFFPYIHTFAVFIYRRPYDQLAMSIAYPNLPVRLIGFLPGITTPGGVTHQAIDDIAILRAMPNMNILDCGDATDVESVLDLAQSIDGPVYVRMLRGEVPRLFDKSESIAFNRARVLSLGNDITILSEGICTEEVMRASAILKSGGLSLTHLHITTLKPFSDPQVLEAIQTSRYGVITMENHTVIGGLGSAVAELMAENGIGKRLVRLGLQDTYAHGASRSYLMKEYHLDAISLVQAIEKLIGEELHIKENDLAEVRIQPVHSAAKAEAL
jgi:transketolase